MLNEQPVLIWSAEQNRWISTTIYFVDQPATTTNILDIDTDTTSSVPAPTAISSLFIEPTSGYQEILPLGSICPETEIWYTDSSKTKKIVEKDIVWSGLVPVTINYKLYAADGVTVTQKIRDEMSYDKNIFPTSVIRSIV